MAELKIQGGQSDVNKRNQVAAAREVFWTDRSADCKRLLAILAEKTSAALRRSRWHFSDCKLPGGQVGVEMVRHQVLGSRDFRDIGMSGSFCLEDVGLLAPT